MSATIKRTALVVVGAALSWVMFSPAPLIIALLFVKSIY